MGKNYILITIAALFLTCFAIKEGLAETYSTNFTLTEDPISEGGRWINGKTDGGDWSDCATNGSYVYGKMVTSSNYNDDTCILTGTWGTNQTAFGTIYSNVDGGATGEEEAEIRLLSSIIRGENKGYEILIDLNRNNGYGIQIVRWNGPRGDYDILTSGNVATGKTGDVLKGTSVVTANSVTIRAYVNDRLIATAVDSSASRITSGNPGIGFYKNSYNGNNYDVGFTVYYATDGVSEPAIPEPPKNLHVVD